MEATEKNTTFHVGICMAGAISAGAYTAGVMDYLLEALENWQKAKEIENTGKILENGDYTRVPKHNISIDVLGGASAGGMTAAITAAATQINFEPVKQSDENNHGKTSQNPLYNSWVNLTEDNNSDMITQMLNTDDIENSNTNEHREVRAAFNSSFINKIAESVLDKSIESAYIRPYIAYDADVFTTVTNLRGFNYKITFKTTSGFRDHHMKMHRDYAFFKFTNNSVPHISNKPSVILAGDLSNASTSDLPNDGRIPFNFNSPNGLNVNILMQAAMSTGAFPIGLESRDLSRGRAYIENNKYLNLMLSVKDKENAKYNLLPADEPFETLNVDGGVINNEPYEITQSLLDDRRQNALKELDSSEQYIVKTSASEFDSTVIMIDPFPSEDITDEVYVPRKAWLNVIPSIISAMLGQLMMKDEQIKRAYLSEDYTRFLIMPVRSSDLKDETTENDDKTYPIACGSLGGFGGFFSKKFRAHDYFLGRRNCQRFIQEHFSVPVLARNPILKFGYAGTKGYVIKTYNTERKGAKRFLPLIPDLRIVGDEISGYKLVKPVKEEKYPYPQIKLSYLLGLKDKIQKRVSCILDNVRNVEDLKTSKHEEGSQIAITSKLYKKSKIEVFITKILLYVYLGIGKFFGKKAIAKACLKAIIDDMEKRKLIDVDVKL